MHYEISVYRPVDHGDNRKWCADVYAVGGGGRRRVYCGAAHDRISDAMREAATATESEHHYMTERAAEVSR